MLELFVLCSFAALVMFLFRFNVEAILSDYFGIGDETPEALAKRAKEVEIRHVFEDRAYKIVATNHGSRCFKLSVDLKNNIWTTTQRAFWRQKVLGKICLPPGETVTLASIYYDVPDDHTEALKEWFNMVVDLGPDLSIIAVTNPNCRETLRFTVSAMSTNIPWPMGLPRYILKDGQMEPVPSAMVSMWAINFVGGLLDGKDFSGFLGIDKEHYELPKIIKTMNCVGDLMFVTSKELGVPCPMVKNE